MMDDAVIRGTGVGKRYLIGHKGQPAATFRDRLVDTGRGLGRNIRRTMQGGQIVSGETIEEFWALKGIDFEIKRGDTVGIIGRNGAGKSTLLKVLSRITEPTTGRIEIKGQVASLLEVGTGFHPELTGRENIFLNGAILGMTRAEIRRRFDEIVDFAGVGRFLDTPVKRYSSGMYVRLAFSVAAHLEPEILVVDEVLAVGDAEFQKKCLGKMETVAGQGRTVLFVSHNMAAVQRLCRTGLLLEAGHIAHAGPVGDCLALYSGSFSTKTAMDVRENGLRVALRIEGCGDSNAIEAGHPMTIVADCLNETEATIEGELLISIRNSENAMLSQLSSAVQSGRTTFPPGASAIRFTFQRTPFSVGGYELNLAVRHGSCDILRGANLAKFFVTRGTFYPSGWSPRTDIEVPLLDYHVTQAHLEEA